jgi:hypothetical protein
MPTSDWFTSRTSSPRDVSWWTWELPIQCSRTPHLALQVVQPWLEPLESRFLVGERNNLTSPSAGGAFAGLFCWWHFNSLLLGWISCAITVYWLNRQPISWLTGTHCMCCRAVLHHLALLLLLPPLLEIFWPLQFRSLLLGHRGPRWTCM